MTGSDWKRLGNYVARQRAALGYKTTRAFAEATGISEKTLGKLEMGTRVGRNTLITVESYLQWAPGSCAAILAGGEPTLEGTAATLAEVTKMTPDQLAHEYERIRKVRDPKAAGEWLTWALETREAATKAGPDDSPRRTDRETG